MKLEFDNGKCKYETKDAKFVIFMLPSGYLISTWKRRMGDHAGYYVLVRQLFLKDYDSLVKYIEKIG